MYIHMYIYMHVHVHVHINVCTCICVPDDKQLNKCYYKQQNKKIIKKIETVEHKLHGTIIVQNHIHEPDILTVYTRCA